MKTSVYRGGGTLTTEDWPVPVIGPRDLLVRLRGCGLCGSDIAKVSAPATRVPSVFGHELVGDVVAAGDEVADFALGDRVVAAHHVPCGTCHLCRRGSESMCPAFKASHLDPGGFAEFVRVPEPNVRHATFRVPAHVTDETASFVEPLACCLRAVRRMRITSGDTAAVVGLGSIGSMFVQLLRRAGATVVGVDPIDSRAALAVTLGARVAASPDTAARALRTVSDGRGADVVVVTGGGADVLPWGAGVVRDGGSIHYFAGGGGTVLPLALEELYHRELTIMTTYSSSPRDLTDAFTLLVAGEVDVSALVTHRLPLTHVAEAVDLMRRREALKVFVTP